MKNPAGLPALFSYGVLGLPLAFVALPIYVHVPALYSQHFGLSLALVGGVLLAARLWDALIDPLIGMAIDRWLWRKRAIAASLPCLALGLLGLMNPPVGNVGALWLGAMLWLVYLGYSLASVAHQVWGAELCSDAHARTRVTAIREGFALLGVLLAASLPDLIGATQAEGLSRMAWVFVALLLLAAVIALGFAPVGKPLPGARPGWASLLRAWRGPAFRQLLAVFALSGIAAAVPATLVLFFVADVLQLQNSGIFLGLYFLAAAAGLPGWVWLSRRIGKLRSWAIAMLLAIAVFGWASLLGAGDATAFGVICVLSGLALGADLALPPSMLADVIAAEAAVSADAGTGAYFGWWNFVSKLNLALAAGLALPLLGALGYAPGSRDAAALAALAAIYAGLPALLKMLALWLLWQRRAVLENLAGDGK